MNELNNEINQEYRTAIVAFEIVLLIVLVIVSNKYIKDYSYNKYASDESVSEELFSFLRSEKSQKVFEYVKENGMLYEYSEEYIESTIIYFEANYSGEELELYESILLGGFDFEEYTKEHTYFDFLDVIYEIDSNLENTYVYEDGVNSVREIYVRVRFWDLYNKIM